MHLIGDRGEEVAGQQREQVEGSGVAEVLIGLDNPLRRIRKDKEAVRYPETGPAGSTATQQEKRLRTGQQRAVNSLP